jgi:rhamnogalacturonan endolyase
MAAYYFPIALFAKTGDDGVINFDVPIGQKGSTTLRVGTTLSFHGGRPVPSNGLWKGAGSGAPQLIDSRGVTRGGYKGFGYVYTWTVLGGSSKQDRTH